MPLNPALIASLGPLAVRARRVVEGYLAGRHRSPYRGFGVEFAEHRDYAPGDDPRYLDWKLHARTGRHHLKQFEEETDFAAHLLLDASGSMAYRGESAAWSKLDCATTLAAAAAYLVLRQRDAVGLTVFDHRPRVVLPPSGRASQWNRLSGLLDTIVAGEETELGPVLHAAGAAVPRRGLVVLFSDLFDEPESLLRGLRHLCHRRHDVRVVQVVDPAEADFPFEEPLRFLGMEGQPNVEIDAAALATAYREEFAAHRRAIVAGCRDMGASYLLARTDAAPDQLLASLFAEPSAGGGSDLRKT